MKKCAPAALLAAAAIAVVALFCSTASAADFDLTVDSKWLIIKVFVNGQQAFYEEPMFPHLSPRIIFAGSLDRWIIKGKNEVKFVLKSKSGNAADLAFSAKLSIWEGSKRVWADEVTLSSDEKQLLAKGQEVTLIRYLEYN